MAPDAVLQQVGGAAQGLTSSEARQRLATHGPNLLPPPRRRGPLLRLLLQFHNPLIYVLLAAAGVTLWLEDHVDAAVILTTVIYYMNNVL